MRKLTTRTPALFLCLPTIYQSYQSTLRRGVGLAGMWYRFGKSGTLRIEAHAELAQDGHFVDLLYRGRLRPGDEHRGLADGRGGAGRAARRASK